MQSCVDFRSYRLYEPGLNGGSRIVGLISRVKGERMVRKETAETGVDEDGETLCFRLKDIQRLGKRDSLVFANAKPVTQFPADAEPSSTVFSQGELMALAGRTFKHGRSRTARMSDEQRAQRKDKYGRQLALEDLVERATNKFTVWAELGPALKELVHESNASFEG